ncbi:cupin domain-containing protein [Saccharothrix luteola]|uniref:cupin domain-containing protein n=1 Tax=Saccharothrix luteola TaxID=2893018 RepID=UPI001E4C678E|nr:cupin domain-containing protein [Saccharothrix luteola]MCC8250106.1 cupin domain-containing protein [Saccharothrix luteola]
MDQAALATKLDVPVSVVRGWESGSPEEPLDLTGLAGVAAALSTSIADLVPAPEDDLTDGVRLQLPEEDSSVVGRRGGMDYYVYRSLVRSPSVPMLVPLVVDVLVDDPERAEFNGGHAAHEFIYVMEGSVHMQWGDETAPKTADLPTGASIYISPHVSHTFTALGGRNARLLSVNF